MTEPQPTAKTNPILSTGSQQTPVQTAPLASTGRKLHRGATAELWRWAITAAITIAVAIGLLIGSFIIAIYMQARSAEFTQVDAIIVLGTAQYNGVPSPDLKARLDEALAAYEEGLAPYIIVTGGKIEGDAYTEAETGLIYLTDNGVPTSAILMEDQGRDSWQSMQGAAEILNARELERVLIISDGFHLFRLKVMARELGFTAFGRAASDSPIRRNGSSEFNYVLRETGATMLFLISH